MTKPVAFVTNTAPNSSPLRRVSFSESALRSNLERLASTTPSALIDVRLDAYGHGSNWVTHIADELGFVNVLEEGNDEITDTTRAIYGGIDGTPVASLSGEIVAVKEIQRGDAVSYGYTWTAERATQLALVSLGFADGLPRAGSNTCSFVVGQAVAPIVGRIAMDQCVLDVTGLNVSVGDIATTWTTSENTASWASASGREPLSLVAGLTWRVEREWTR